MSSLLLASPVTATHFTAERLLRTLPMLAAPLALAALFTALSFAQAPAGLVTSPQAQPAASSRSAPPASTAPPAALRVVKLLWKSQPASAAGALEKLIDQALSRREIEPLRPHLASLAETMKASLDDSRDLRWAAAVAALSLSGDATGVRLNQAAVTQSATDAEDAKSDIAALPINKRDFLLRVWLEAEPQKAINYLQAVITDADPLGGELAWLEIAALRALEADRERTSSKLVERWATLPKSVHVALVEPLTQQSVSMRQLVEAISDGKISKDLVNTNQLLKWSAGPDQELKTAIERVWGKLRTSDDADRKAVVSHTLKVLQSGKAGDPVSGEQVFKRVCSQCHRLHGEGIEVGPDITNNGRGSFEQLVSNVMDPSLVIGTAFLSKTVLTADGQVLAGLVAAEDAKRLTLKIQGGKLVELNREEDIEEIKESTKSLMPDGLEQQMKEQELTDLFAFLSLIRPLSAPENETIPGTPPKLVQ